METGSWDIAVQIGIYPQKVASALTALGDTLMGAEYEPIAYVGSQVVNGINHAVLAKQTVLSGKDTANIVMMIFNEKPNDMVATLVSIDRLVESGAELGGVNIDVQTELSDEVMEVWNSAFEVWMGGTMTPYALLGTQMTKGTDYIFAAAFSANTVEPWEKALLITINPMTKDVHIADMLASKYETSLGYAFNW